MSELLKAKEPFHFYTRLCLTELTGLRASTLSQLVVLLKGALDSCVYHHTHRFLQQNQNLAPEPHNDFAWWANEALKEPVLAEKLAAIDAMQFSDIGALREKIIRVIEDFLSANPLAKLSFARAGEEFYLMKSVSFIAPTQYRAGDLKEFVEILKLVTIDSVYFHIFEARLRLGKPTNDFSNWIEHSLSDAELSQRVSGFDLYTRSLEDLRKKIIKVIERRLSL